MQNRCSNIDSSKEKEIKIIMNKELEKVSYSANVQRPYKNFEKKNMKLDIFKNHKTFIYIHMYMCILHVHFLTTW